LWIDLAEDGKVIMHSFEVDMKAGRQGGRKRSKFKQNPLEWFKDKHFRRRCVIQLIFLLGGCTNT
jgi:hypothetical protein